MERYAQVLINIKTRELDMPFTYRVPEGVDLLPGCRVIVPFAGRLVEGYCVEINHVPFEGEVKDIKEVIDETPLLTEELLALSAWGAERYLCRRQDFFLAMIPPGLRRQAVKMVHYRGDREPEDEMLAYLKANGPLPLDKWSLLFPQARDQALLRRLRDRGIILIEEREKSGAGLRKMQVVRLTGKEASVRGAKQQKLLSLLKERGQLAVRELAGFGISRETLNSLVRLSLVTVEEAEHVPPKAEDELPAQPFSPTPDQAAALAEICSHVEAGRHRVVLLHGVTGSGKTEVYLQAIETVRRLGMGSIVMVPEIALTPQMIERFTARFGNEVAVLHSRLSPQERLAEWQRVAEGKASVVVGARLAVFAPFKKLGLIVLDEEHENTYKQEETPRYHARDVAAWRAKWHECPVVLGSATPSVESAYKVRSGEYTLCRLPSRVHQRPLPPVEVVDMRQELKRGNRSIFSRALRKEIEDTLALGQQVILFINRRGFATFVLCRACGHVMNCPHCRVALKYHSEEARLKCHYCGYSEKYPLVCPSCRSRTIRHFGTGTQKVAEEAARLFPGARIARLDADAATRKGAHEKILGAFRRGETDILVGTQMVAKGLDFSRVRLVGVITADTMLNLPDFRAGERTFALLTQVSGRTGRGNEQGKAIIQTYAPHSYAVVAAARHDYDAFFQQEIQSRQDLAYPPFTHMVRFLLSGSDESRLETQATELSARLAGVDVLGPSPCPVPKIKGRFRWHVIARHPELPVLLSAARSVLREFAGMFKKDGTRLVADVDPYSFL